MSTVNHVIVVGKNFFFQSVPDDSNAEVDEDTRALLTADFEIGHYIRESIVPRATLYFTGIQLHCISSVVKINILSVR